MKLTIESTAEIYLAEELTAPRAVMLRKWIGTTDDGVPVHAYIAVVSPQTHDPEVEARFAAEFAERTVVSRALTPSAAYMLQWLGQEDFSQYGECKGAALDELVAAGFAQIHAPGEHQGSFIAKGSGDDYRAVSLTEAGIAALTAASQGQ